MWLVEEEQGNTIWLPSWDIDHSNPWGCCSTLLHSEGSYSVHNPSLLSHVRHATSPGELQGLCHYLRTEILVSLHSFLLLLGVLSDLPRWSTWFMLPIGTGCHSLCTSLPYDSPSYSFLPSSTDNQQGSSFLTGTGVIICSQYYPSILTSQIMYMVLYQIKLHVKLGWIITFKLKNYF